MELNDRERDLRASFNLSGADQNVLKEFKQLQSPNATVTWWVRRIWIDERASDNLRCYLIFQLGRAYQAEVGRRGGDEIRT